MSNRRMNQFMYGFERQPVMLSGSFTQSGSTGTFAVLVSQGVTYTANRMGTYGNGITITITGGATAGAEVVTVSNKAISIQIESGVSTITQVRTAVNASTAAAALVTATGTSSSTVASATVLSLATGTSTPFTTVCKGMTIDQTGTGIFTLTLQSSYPNLLSFSCGIQKASAADLKAQIKSADPTSTSQTIVFRIIAVATPTNLASGDVMYINALLRNSSG